MAKLFGRASRASSVISETVDMMNEYADTAEKTFMRMGGVVNKHTEALRQNAEQARVAAKAMQSGYSSAEAGWRSLAANVMRLDRDMVDMLDMMPDHVREMAERSIKAKAGAMELGLKQQAKMIKDFFLHLDKESRKIVAENGFLSMLAGMTDNKMLKGVIKGLEGVGKLLKKFGKTMKKMASDVWTWVLKKAKEAFDMIVNVLFGNAFREVQRKLRELRDMFMEFPGAEAALSNLRAIRDTLVEIRQQYGATVEQSRELTNVIYEQSDAIISVTDNLRAMQAAAGANVRGTENTAQYTQDIARISRATGENEQAVADMLVMMRRDMQMTREQALQSAAAFDYFTQQVGQRYEYGTDYSTIRQLYQGSREAMIRGGVGGGETGYQQAAMVTAQLGAQTGIDPQQLMGLLTEVGTPGSTLIQRLGNPEAALRRLRSGDAAGFWTAIAQDFASMTGPESRMFIEELNNLGLGLPAESLMLLQNGVGNLTALNELAAGSFEDVGDASEHFAKRAEENTTPLQELENTIETIGNNTEIAGMRFGEFLDVLDMSSTYFDELMGGFTMMEQGIDFAFGPLGGAVNTVAQPLMALMTAGGAFGDFSEEELGGMGILGEWMLGMRDFKESFWDKRLEPILRDLWQGIVRFFEPGPNGERSLFARLIDQGIEWVQTHGPQIVEDISIVAISILDAIDQAFASLEDSELGTTMVTTLVTIMEHALPVLVKMVRVFVNLAKVIIDGLKDAFADSGVRSSLQGFFEGLIESLIDLVTDVAPLLLELGMTMVQAMWGAFTTIGEAIFEGIANSVPPGMLRNLLGLDAQEASGTVSGNAMSMLERGDITGARGTVLDMLSDSGLVGKMSREEQADYLYFLSQTGGYDNLDSMYLNMITPQAGPFSAAAMPVVQETFGGSRDIETMRARQMAINMQLGDESLMSAFHVGPMGNVTPQGSMYNALRNAGTPDEYRHGGQDMQAPLRTPVPALASGFIVRSGFQDDGWGRFVLLQHPDMVDADGRVMHTLYAHLDEDYGAALAANVAEAGGMLPVEEGTTIGLVGATGNASSDYPHVHIESGYGWTNVKEDGSYGAGSIASRQDPAALIAGLAQGGVVLNEMIARVGEGGRPERVQPLDEFYEREDAKTQQLIDAIREQTDALSLALEALGDDGLLSGFMGGKR